MKVKATKMGYYDLKRKREGVEFEIVSENEFSPRWMEKVEEAQPKKQKPKPSSENQVQEAL